jgi:serine/threonine protein kinase
MPELDRFAWTAGTQFSRYQIVCRLAAGGMAEVWKARVLGVEGFQKDVVVKTMRPELADSVHLVRMFINEAEIAARMNHPGMIQVFDFGQVEGRYFIAMEYVPGRSLRQLGRALRQRQRRLPRPFLVRTMLEVVRALGYAHALTDGGAPIGFVHRDVSPENVMLSGAGATKVIDFGASSTSTTPPPAGALVGKIRYLSPERLRGEVGDARSDLYSVGIMLYEYLTGASPYDGPDMVKKIIKGEAPDVCAKTSLPAALAAVVRRAMAADLRRRYGWADRLADELGNLLTTDLGHDPYGANESDVIEVLNGAEAEVEALEASATPAPGKSLEAQTPRLRIVPPPAPAERAIAAASASLFSADDIDDIGELCVEEGAAAKHRPRGRATTRQVETAAPQVGATARAAVAGAAARPRPAVPQPPRDQPPADAPEVPRAESDPFAAARRAGVNPVAAWFRDGRAEADLPPSGGGAGAGLTDDEGAAAACFERGLALATEHRWREARVYWERAVALAPNRRSYQVNLRRLAAQLQRGEESTASRVPSNTSTETSTTNTSQPTSVPHKIIREIQ